MIELRVPADAPVTTIGAVQAIAERFPGGHPLRLVIDAPPLSSRGEAVLDFGERWRCSAVPAVLSLLREHADVRVVVGG